MKNSLEKLFKSTCNNNKGRLKTSSTTVDDVIRLKEQINALEAELEEKYSSLTEAVMSQQEEDTRAGNFYKTYLASSSNCKMLQCITLDKFTVPDDPASLVKLKELLKDKFDKWIQVKCDIKIKEEIINSDKIDKLINLMQKNGLNVEDYFEVKRKYVTSKGLDKDQYSLDKDSFKVFKTIVSQARPIYKMGVKSE